MSVWGVFAAARTAVPFAQQVCHECPPRVTTVRDENVAVLAEDTGFGTSQPGFGAKISSARRLLGAVNTMTPRLLLLVVFSFVALLVIQIAQIDRNPTSDISLAQVQ